MYFLRTSVWKDIEEFSIGICQLKLSLISAQDKYKSSNWGETKYNTNSTPSLLLLPAQAGAGEILLIFVNCLVFKAQSLYCIGPRFNDGRNFFFRGLDSTYLYWYYIKYYFLLITKSWVFHQPWQCSTAEISLEFTDNSVVKNRKEVLWLLPAEW